MDIEDMGIEEYDFYDDPSEDDDIDWYNLLEIEYLRENWLDERADDWTSREDDLDSDFDNLNDEEYPVD